MVQRMLSVYLTPHNTQIVFSVSMGI